MYYQLNFMYLFLNCTCEHQLNNVLGSLTNKAETGDWVVQPKVCGQESATFGNDEEPLPSENEIIKPWIVWNTSKKYVLYHKFPPIKMHLWQKHLLRIISRIYTIPLDLHYFAGSYTKTSNNLVNSSGRPLTMNFEQNRGCLFFLQNW